MDVYWETIEAQRSFDGDYESLQALAGQWPASVYLNALLWHEGVEYLLDRMDHYVVYVSSITESVIWELQQLDTDARRERVTVVFDEEAIAKKEGWAELPEAVAAKAHAEVTWSFKGSPVRRPRRSLRMRIVGLEMSGLGGGGTAARRGD